MARPAESMMVLTWLRRAPLPLHLSSRDRCSHTSTSKFLRKGFPSLSFGIPLEREDFGDVSGTEDVQILIGNLTVFNLYLETIR